ncbi:hypothetical protein chiPu_0030129, partial [Chiloscyllium punctatum]|nr:hypothetical protein [Chiloscyllium punctatum]
DLLDVAHQGLDAIQHQIEILGNAIPFVVTAAERDALVEAGEHDGAAGRIDRFDAADRPPRDPDAGGSRQPDDQHHNGDPCGPDLRHEAVEIADIAADQQPFTARQGLGHGSHQHGSGSEPRRRGPKFRPSPLAGVRRPHSEISGQHCRSGVDQQIHMVGKVLVSDALRDQCGQTLAAGPRIGTVEAHLLGHDRAVGPVAYIGQRRPVDIGEDRGHDQAEDADGDQGQAERR